MREIIIDSWPRFTFLSTILMVWLQAKGLWMIILCNKINIVTLASISKCSYFFVYRYIKEISEKSFRLLVLIKKVSSLFKRLHEGIEVYFLHFT